MPVTPILSVMPFDQARVTLIKYIYPDQADMPQNRMGCYFYDKHSDKVC